MESKIDGDARIFVILVCFSTRCIFLLVVWSHVGVHAFGPYRSPCTEREIVPVFVFWAWRDSFFPPPGARICWNRTCGNERENIIAPKRAECLFFPPVFPAGEVLDTDNFWATEFSVSSRMLFFAPYFWEACGKPKEMKSPKCQRGASEWVSEIGVNQKHGAVPQSRCRKKAKGGRKWIAGKHFMPLTATKYQCSVSSEESRQRKSFLQPEKSANGGWKKQNA